MSAASARRRSPASPARLWLMPTPRPWLIGSFFQPAGTGVGAEPKKCSGLRTRTCQHLRCFAGLSRSTVCDFSTRADVFASSSGSKRIARAGKGSVRMVCEGRLLRRGGATWGRSVATNK